MRSSITTSTGVLSPPEKLAARVSKACFDAKLSGRVLTPEVPVRMPSEDTAAAPSTTTAATRLSTGRAITTWVTLSQKPPARPASPVAA